MSRESWNIIVGLVNDAKNDLDKFYVKETNAAGGRLRKVLKEIGNIIKDENKNIIEIRNKRTKKSE